MGFITALLATAFFSLGLSTPSCVIHAGKTKTADGFEVEWNEYLPQGAAADDTVIIMPPTGGSTILERRYARGICDRHHRATIIERWSGLGEHVLDFGMHNRLYARAHRAFGLVSDRYPGPLRLMGTSLGAQYGFSIVLRTPRIERAVLIVGGIPFSTVIARSEHESMTSLRNWRTKEWGIPSQDNYEDRLRKVFAWDDKALIDADPSKSKKFLLFVGLRDEAVPTARQLELAQKLSEAQVTRIDSDHVGTILRTYLFHHGEIDDFLTGETSPK